LENFIKAVRNVENRSTAGSKSPDESEESDRFTIRESSSRLVEDKNFGLRRGGPRDLNELLMRGAQGSCSRKRVDGWIDRGEMFPGRTQRSAPINSKFSTGVVSEKNILCHRQEWAQVELLRSDGDSCAMGVDGRGEIQRFAIPTQLALGGAQLAADDVHERTFSCAVLTRYGVHLPGPDIDTHVPERILRAEALREISAFEEQLVCRRIRLHGK